jgi:hypothetical protein
LHQIIEAGNNEKNEPRQHIIQPQLFVRESSR